MLDQPEEVPEQQVPRVDRHPVEVRLRNALARQAGGAQKRLAALRVLRVVAQALGEEGRHGLGVDGGLREVVLDGGHAVLHACRRSLSLSVAVFRTLEMWNSGGAGEGRRRRVVVAVVGGGGGRRR